MKGPNDFLTPLTEADEQMVEKLCAKIENAAAKGARFPWFIDADETTPMPILRAVLAKASAAGWDAEIKQRTLARMSLFIKGPAR